MKRKTRRKKMGVKTMMERKPRPNTLVEICYKTWRRERAWNH